CRSLADPGREDRGPDRRADRPRPFRRAAAAVDLRVAALGRSRRRGAGRRGLHRGLPGVPLRSAGAHRLPEERHEPGMADRPAGGPVMQDYTLEELVIARMAKEYRGGLMGVGATILADLSARLAKALYAPDLFLTTISRAAADPSLHAKTFNDEWALDVTAEMALSWVDMFRLIAQVKLHIFIRTVQLDRYGASNISVIGDWSKPKAQLIGARGIPDDLWGCERLNFHIRSHNPKVFVEKVDFVCGFGKRPDLGPTGIAPAKPGIVVSDLGVFDFE